MISTTIEARRFTPPAVFNAAYQAEHRGRTEVEDPEVYELINVAIAISAFGQAETDLVYHDSDYYRAVQAHFAPFADQPLIEQIDALLREDRANYFPLKMNGYAFVFDNQGHIVRSPVYDRTGFEGSVENALLPLLDDLNEFANASDFRDFYNQNRRIYEGQTLFFEHEAQVSRISSWLSEQFPSVKPYDGVKIVFSPLVAYNQSLTMIEADGYRELQPHVNYPYISKPGLSEAGAVVERSAVLFTEMNHGFVNPVSGRYAGRISAALTDRSMWADDERSASSYQSAESLFDEYMNWGLVSLYDHDVMKPEDFAIAHAGTVENMQTVRGFRKFSGFEAELLRLYRDRVHGQTVEDLYPSIIAWFEQRALATEAGGS